MKRLTNDNKATWLGVVVSLATAMSLIDFDTFNPDRVNDWVKLMVVLLPAIQGKITTMKNEQQESMPPNAQP